MLNVYNNKEEDTSYSSTDCNGCFVILSPEVTNYFEPQFFASLLFSLLL